MSAEVFESLYLRCDHVFDGNARCPSTYPFHRGTGPVVSGDALEVLARHARDEGWHTETKHEGLKGWSASSLCPDHASDTTQETKP